MSKIITVPKDKEALAKLDFDDASSSCLIELSISENEYLHLERIYFFENINKLSGSLIDNYEDDSIVDLEILKSVYEFLNKKYKNDNYYDTLISPILGLFNEAIKRETGFFFFF